MTKITDFIKRKGTSLSRNTNAPLELRKQGVRDSTGRDNRNREGVLKFYPVLHRHPLVRDGYVDGYNPVTSTLDSGQNIYSLDIFIKYETSDGSDAEVNLSSVQIDLPEFLKLKNVNVWNKILKTKWGNNIPEIRGLPDEQWPSGTIPQMIRSGNSPFEIASNIHSTHTVWCTFVPTIHDPETYFEIGYGNPQYLPDFHFNKVCINENDLENWNIPEHMYSLQSPTFSILGSSRGNGTFGWVRDRSLVETDHEDVFQGSDYRKFLRIENVIPQLSGNNNLFNLCIQNQRIKATALNGDGVEVTLGVQGMCTNDFIEESGLDTSDGRRLVCDGLNGILCRGNDRQCVYDTRDCVDYGVIQPLDCNCNIFNCASCFTFDVSNPQQSLPYCCRQCCSGWSDGSNYVNPDVVISGCTDREACNYWTMANTDDGSCWYPRDYDWCDCNENVFDECGVCGGNGVDWGYNSNTTNIGVINPDAGCCPQEHLRVVYFDNNCDGVGDSQFTYTMCVNQIQSGRTRAYCSEITDGVCSECFVQSNSDNLECPSNYVDCAGLCDGDSHYSDNPFTKELQCCTDLQKDDCGVCFGDNSMCTCKRPTDSGCICGCTDKLAANYNPRANWPCGSKKNDKECYNENNASINYKNESNSCCWYWDENDKPQGDVVLDKPSECNEEHPLWFDCMVNMEENSVDMKYIKYDDGKGFHQNPLLDKDGVLHTCCMKIYGWLK